MTFNKYMAGLLSGVMVTVGAQGGIGIIAPAGAQPRPAPAAMAIKPATCSREQEAANKRFVLGLIPPTPDSLVAAMDDNYVQHSPEAVKFMQMNGVSGKAGMELLRQAFVKLDIMKRAAPPPPPAGDGPPPKMVSEAIAECDLVLTVGEMRLPDPSSPGKTYTAYNFDLWRVKNGKLTEHWDNIRIGNPPAPYLAAPFKDLKAAS